MDWTWESFQWKWLKTFIPCVEWRQKPVQSIFKSIFDLLFQTIFLTKWIYASFRIAVVGIMNRFIRAHELKRYGFFSFMFVSRFQLSSRPMQKNSGNFCLRNPESGNILLVESGINPGLWDPQYSWKKTGILLRIGIQNTSFTVIDWNPVPGIRNPKRGIQNPRLSLIPLHGATQDWFGHLIQFRACTRRSRCLT